MLDGATTRFAAPRAASPRARGSRALALGGTSKRAVRTRLYLGLLLIDVGCVVAGFALANIFRLGDAFASQGVDLVVVLLPLFVILSFGSRSYTLTSLETPRRGIWRVTKAFGLAAATIVGVIFYLKVSTEFSRLVFGLGTLFSLLLLLTARYLFGRWAGARHRWNFTDVVVLVDGVPVPPQRGQIVVLADQAELSPTANDPVTLQRVGRLLAHCDRVILSAPLERRPQWTRMLKCAGVDVEVLAPELDHLGALRLGRSDGRTTILISSGPLDLRQSTAKRVLDLAVTLPALLVAGPLLAVAAAMVKLDSPGPVFFRQERVGRGNRLFRILKLRTMRTNLADLAGARSTSRHDDRVTRIGKFLRRTSLDELPQLLNVLKGEMSIVGPRPHALASTAEESLFWNIDARYWERGAVKPGITGLAQVRGYRGATMTREDLTLRVQADLEYVSGWTVWRDIGIILRTVKVLVHDRAF